MEKIPESHLVPGTQFAVDAFKFGSRSQKITSWFLTHGHADHYGGLDELWAKGEGLRLARPFCGRWRYFMNVN